MITRETVKGHTAGCFLPPINHKASDAYLRPHSLHFWRKTELKRQRALNLIIKSDSIKDEHLYGRDFYLHPHSGAATIKAASA